MSLLRFIDRPHSDNIFIRPLYEYEELLSTSYFRAAVLDAERQTFLREIAALLSMLDQPAQIVVAGGFNAGKSTFINALMGSEIMPVKPIRTTATVNCLMVGDRQEYRVYRLSGAEEGFGYLDDEDLNLQLRTLMVQDRESIDHVEIKRPSGDLHFLDKFTLIDTPGLDFSEQDTAATLRYVEQADAIIWLLHPEGIRNSHDMRYILQFHTANPSSPLVIVINQIDDLDEDELVSVQRTVGIQLTGIANRIFSLSARQAFEGILHRDKIKIDASRFAELQHYLHNHLFNSFRDLLDQRIKQKLAKNSEDLQIRIRRFLNWHAKEIVPRIPIKAEDFSLVLARLEQKEKAIFSQIASLQYDLEQVMADKRSLIEANAVCSGGFMPPDVDLLLEYLPAFFPNFWNIVSPEEFAKIVGLKSPPIIPSPFPIPDRQTVESLKQKFCQFTILGQLALIAFCRNLLVRYHSLSLRYEMLDLLEPGLDLA